MKNIPCNLCNKNRTKVIKKFHSDNVFNRTIVKCVNCGLVYVNPQPQIDVLEKIYQQGAVTNMDDNPTENIMPAKPSNKRISRRINFLKDIKEPGRLLDVGCGTGEFIYYAQKERWNVFGIDISANRSKIAQIRTGIKIHKGTIHDSSYEMNSFDLITLFEVIEHLPDVKATLKKAFQLLKPGGIIAISTPNINSLRRLYQGIKWKGFTDDPNHIFFFNKKTLISMLKSCGFTIKKTLTVKISAVALKWLSHFGLGNEIEIYAQKELK